MANSETSAKNPSYMAQLAGYFYSPTVQNRPDLVTRPPSSSTTATIQSEPPAEVTLVVSPPSSSPSATAHTASTTDVSLEVVDTAAQVQVASVIETAAPDQLQASVDSTDSPPVAPPTEVSPSDSVNELPNEAPLIPPSILQSTYHSAQGSAIQAKQRLNEVLERPNVQAAIAGGMTALAISLGVNYAPHQDVAPDIDLTRDDVTYSTYVPSVRMLEAEGFSSPSSESGMLTSPGYIALISAAGWEWGSWALERFVAGVTAILMTPFNLFVELASFMSSIPTHLSSFADMVSSAISSALGTAAQVAKENPVVTTAVTTVVVAYGAKRAVDFGYQAYKDRQAQTSTPAPSDSQQPEATVSDSPSASNDEHKFRHLIDHLSEQVSRLPSLKRQ